MANEEARHPATEHMLRTFGYEHLPEFLQEISRPFHDLAVGMAAKLDDGPELTAGLRKLREAKDCMVMCRVIAKQDRDRIQDLAEQVDR